MRELNKAEVEAFSKKLGYLISDADMLRGVIVDISGGGLRFVSRTPYRQGTVLYLKYKLEIADKEKEFNMAAMVLSSEQIPNRADEYQNRVKFLNMNTTHGKISSSTFLMKNVKTEKMEKVNKKYDNIIKCTKK